MPSTLRDAPSGPVAPASAMPPGVIQVADLATLTLLAPSTRVSDGALAYVQRLKRCFQLDRSSIEAPLGGQRVAATGGGIWRSTNYYSPQASPWAVRTSWHIDAVNGSVEGDGSAANPIDSWTELLSRIAFQQLLPSTVISVHSSLNETIDASTLVPDPTGLLIDGNPGAVQVLSAAVQSYTAESLISPGRSPSLKSVAVPDWTPYQGQRVRFTSGPALGAYTIVSVANPAGIGVDTARINRPVIPQFPPTYPAGASFASPAAGNGFIIESLPSILGYRPPCGSRTPVTIRGFQFPRLAYPSVYTQCGNYIVAHGCIFEFTEFRCEGIVLSGCRIGDSVNGGGQYFAQDVQLFGCNTWYSNVLNGRSRWEQVVAQAGLSFVGGGQHLLAHGVGCFDNSAGSGLFITSTGSWAQLHGAVYGGNNSRYGIEVPFGGSGVSYEVKPIVTGTLGDTSIAGVAHAYAAIPFAAAASLSGIVTP